MDDLGDGGGGGDMGNYFVLLRRSRSPISTLILQGNTSDNLPG